MFQFGRKGKLNPRFIGPYEILERIAPVAYRLASLQSWPNYIMCFMSQCCGDTVQMNRTYYQYKMYKCNRTSLLMKSQRLF